MAGSSTMQNLGKCRIAGTVAIATAALTCFILQIIAAVVGANGHMSAGCAILAIATLISLLTISAANAFGGCICCCCQSSLSNRLSPSIQRDHKNLLILCTIGLVLAWVFFAFGLMSELAGWIHTAFFLSKCRSDSWRIFHGTGDCEWAAGIVKSCVIAGVFYLKSGIATGVYLLTSSFLAYESANGTGQPPIASVITTVYPMAAPMQSNFLPPGNMGNMYGDPH